MRIMDKEKVYTELDARHSDGMTVQLLWEAETNETSIRVEDSKKTPPEVTQFKVIGSKALEAFNHPFSFAPTA